MSPRRSIEGERLTLAQARAVGLAAQGFTDVPPAGVPDARHRRRVLDRIGLIQIDSITVLARAHYLPLLSRLGPYPVDLLDRAAYRAPRELFEYWGHEASLLPVALHPAMRWRMRRAHDHAWGGMRTAARDDPALLRAIAGSLAVDGPATAAELERRVDRRPTSRGTWWGWSQVKKAVEFLFWSGEVATAQRRGFERVYDLTERVLPSEVLRQPDLPQDDAHRALMERSARSLGVATESDLRDYFRLQPAPARAALADLVDSGVVRPVLVDGWATTAYLHSASRLPRSVDASALLSPFDPMVWNRQRTERLWGMRYRIEIYVPAAQRQYGYYVLPFLFGDRLRARVDLKADRASGTLAVRSAWREPGGDDDPAMLASLASRLDELASWLGLTEVVVDDVGDAAADLGALVGSGRGARRR